MKYRKDIQILRGIAVLLVVFFHLNIAGFNSGFLGVDVFFVISGYLMAVMYNPLKKLEFFVSRARRLLPAYFAIIFFTLLTAIIVTTPNDYIQTSRQALISTLFASNIGYWMENSYFDKSTFRPLLHLWSLGVEIQFYLLLPFLYWIFSKLKVSYVLITSISALLCFIVIGLSPITAFYWLPCRLWEFLIGFGVAKYVKQPGNNSRYWAWFGATALVVIIFIPTLKVDGLALGFMTGHPGLWAFLVSIATAVTLCFGIPKAIETNPIAGLAEKTGRYSYSIYLAHYPVIVLFLYQPFSGTLIKASNFSQTIMIVLLIVFSSAILYKFVEQPFRTNKQPWILALASMCAVFGLTEVGMIMQRKFIPEREMLIYQASMDHDEFRCGNLYAILHRGKITCEITNPIDNPSHRILLVGNSHADSIKATFSSLAQSMNATVFFIVPNNPLMKDSKINLKKIVGEALAKRVDSVVLHYSPNAIDMRKVAELAELLKDRKVKLSFIMPVPVWGRSVPMMLYKNIKDGEPLSNQNIKDYQNFNRSLINELAKINCDNLKVYQIADVFCKSNCAMISKTGKPLYYDDAHLTLTGSEMLKGVFERLISDLS